MQQTSLFNKDDITALKDMVDINYLLDSLGIRATKESSKEVRAACIIHGGDNKSAFRFNKDKRTWVCFTHGCNDIHGNDIISLIRAVMGLDFMGALNYLKELVGDISSYKKSIDKHKFKKESDQFIEQYSKHKIPDYVSEEKLLLYKPLRSQYFINKGFTEEVLNKFDIAGGFTDDFNILRDIVPIRDVNNKLVAYSLRDIRKNAPKEWKYILSEGFIKDKTLYNLNKARVFGTELPLIVVEGFKSVWRFHEYGLYNTIAIMGSNITQGQVDLLRAYAIKGVILMLDPDSAGIEGMEGKKDQFGRLLREGATQILSRYMNVVEVRMDPALGEDPAELTLNQAYGYLNEYIR